MTQPHLLELAKQGDPNAIATLINVTLEPQGVTAKAFVDVDCLCVFLSAARPLNAKALVAFVQRGILRLEVSSIRQVQVYGQRLGDEQPAWVETFAIDALPTADALALETLSHSSTSHGSTSHGSTSHGSMSHGSMSHGSMSHGSEPAFVARSTQAETRMQTGLTFKPRLQASLNSTFVALSMTAKQMVDRLPWRDRYRKEASSQAVTNASPTKNRSVNYLKLSALVTLSAFITGGAVALIANSYTLGGAERKVGGKPATIAAGSQMSLQSSAERTRNLQQTAARRYLETMNKAQQAFYRQNKRFAATLEELERFAAVPIAVRSDYTYKLTVPNNTQAQLTAVPKADGLKSYTAAAAIAKPTNQVVTAICASQQAAQVPPLVFQSTNGAVQCPAEPAKAS